LEDRAQTLAGIRAILLAQTDTGLVPNIAAGHDGDARKFGVEYERMKQLVRENLWNEQDGIYENCFWNGEFSKRLSPTNFYPLFAGIATAQQAKRMIEERLLNSQEFWGTYVAPTIARNDPAFADQFYWRGDIWGLTNYMLYEGINRYGLDKVALECAEKNYNLFMALTRSVRIVLDIHLWPVVRPTAI
jgi:glycogen debranching enzyme